MINIKTIIKNIFKNKNKIEKEFLKMEDKIIICMDCNEEFVFTVGEQEFYLDKEFDEPKRCPVCRRARKQERENRE